MNLLVKPARSLHGTVSVPGDKSVSHRAVMLGALAEGDTIIENFLPGEDCRATVACFQKLGVEITWTGQNSLRVQGNGLDGLREPEDVLDAGNSGTTLRLLLGIIAAQPFFSVLNGDASLRRRPMVRVVDPLILMGARIEGRQGGNLAPLAVRGGGLKSLHYTSAVASAQVKSAILLAGLYADGVTGVTEPHRSRDHTERMLKYFGAKMDVSGTTVQLAGRPRLLGKRVDVPGDLSSAAFLMVAAASLPGSDLTLTRVGINPTRSGIIDALTDMGASIELLNPREEDGEPVAEIRIRYTERLKGIVVGGEIIPRLIDEIPALAVAAALAGGRTEIRDAAELRVKESNRIFSVAEMLASFGATVEELPDGLLIKGRQSLRGCACQSHGDHRIALAGAVAGLLAEGETTVLGAECIDVSFPGFTGVLGKIRMEY